MHIPRKRKSFYFEANTFRLIPRAESRVIVFTPGGERRLAKALICAHGMTRHDHRVRQAHYAIRNFSGPGQTMGFNVDVY